MPGSRARRLAGVVALSVYLVAALATLAGPRHRLLPLFEGSGPPPPYQWVKPPPAFAAANIPPQPRSLDIAASGGKTGAAVAQTADSQVLINFAAGAFALPPGDVKVRVDIIPVDPATLGPLPSRLKADGNAYQIEFTYQPSATPVAALAAESNLIMSAPLPVAGVFYSADRRTWAGLPTSPVSGPSVVGSSLTKAGWFLTGTIHSPVAAAPTGGHATVLIAVVVAGGASVLGVAGLLLARKRRRPAGPAKGGNGRAGTGRTS